MENQESIQKTLIDELGLSDLPVDKQEKLMVKMTEAVLRRIFEETMKKLTETDQKEYIKLIDEDVEPQQLEAFLQEKITHYDELVKKIVEEFKMEMKNPEFKK